MLRDLSRDHVRRRSSPTEADYTRPRAVQELIAGKGWILWPPIPYSYDTVVTDLAEPAPSPPTGARLAGHRRPGARRAGPGDLRLPHLGPVRPRADHPELDRRHRRRRRAGLLRRLGRPRLPALHRDLVEHADALHADHPGELHRAGLLVAARHACCCSAGWRWSAWCAPSSCAAATSTMCAPRARSACWTSRIMCRHILPNAMVASLTFLPFILAGSVDHADRARLPGLRPAARLAVAGRAAAAGQEQPPGALARLHRLRRHRADAVAAGLHRRGGARRLRSAQGARHEARHGRCSRSATSRSPSAPATRRAGGARRQLRRSTAARPWRWSARSGSGKSVTALSVLQLLPYPMAAHPTGSIRFQGQELVGAPATRAPAQRPRQPRVDDLPGADDLAQPAAHDRAAGERGADPAQGPDARGRARGARSSCSSRSAFPRRRRGSTPIRTSSRAASASG